MSEKWYISEWDCCAVIDGPRDCDAALVAKCNCPERAAQIVHEHNGHAALLAACDAWMLVESEMADNHPCPDLALRANYRAKAVRLTKAAIAAARKENMMKQCKHVWVVVCSPNDRGYYAECRAGCRATGPVRPTKAAARAAGEAGIAIAHPVARLAAIAATQEKP